MRHMGRKGFVRLTQVEAAALASGGGVGLGRDESDQPKVEHLDGGCKVDWRSEPHLLRKYRRDGYTDDKGAGNRDTLEDAKVDGARGGIGRIGNVGLADAAHARGHAVDNVGEVEGRESVCGARLEEACESESERCVHHKKNQEKIMRGCDRPHQKEIRGIL